MSKVTRILNEIGSDGDQRVAHELFRAVYSELREMAAAKMAKERLGHSLDATGLVHEAYLRLADKQSFHSRRHFFGAAAEAMKRILIDRARTKSTEKRGGRMNRADLHPESIAESNPRQFDELDESLNRFETLAPEKAELVKLRYFVGLTTQEAAEILGISTATADRYWSYAKAWLAVDMSDQK